jgi:TRAP-type C4-dicarboxylate transport system permease small subunit
MKVFCFSWIFAWAGIGYAQDAIEAVQIASGANAGLTLGAGDMTFPAALILCTTILARWTPKVEIVLTDKRKGE